MTRKHTPTLSLTEPRVRGRAAFAHVLRDVIAEAYARGVALIPQICADLEVTESAVRNWMDPTRPRAPLAAGDLAGLRPAVRMLILDRWIAQLSQPLTHEHGGHAAARDPFREVVAITIRVGKAAEAAEAAMVDGVCDAPDWERVGRHMEAIEAEARRARLACRFASEEARRGRS